MPPPPRRTIAADPKLQRDPPTAPERLPSHADEAGRVGVGSFYERRSALPQYFTRAEAEELLPRIRPLLEEAQRQKLLFDQGREEAEAIEARMKGDGADEDARRLAAKHEVLQALGRRLQELVGKVQELGVEVKDLEMGLVDFRARRGDADYYLCWRVGESGIGWWHTLEGGFAGRRPL